MATLKLFLVIVLLLAAVILLMGVKVFFHKTHKFPETSAGHNKELRKRGIKCARHEEIKRWNSKTKHEGCASCYEHARN